MNILLDRDGDADLPDGYQLLATEMDFLRYADRPAILVRGASLCDWAELFCRARSLPFQNLRSPTRELMAVCPDLHPAQAEEIHRLLGNAFVELPHPFSVQDVLEKLYPQRLWRDAPSWEHGAAWLHWLLTHPFSAAIHPLLASLAGQWRSQAGGYDSQLYAVCAKEEAGQTLLAWLGVAETGLVFAGNDYSQPIPQALLEQIRADWRARIVSTRGGAVEEILTGRVPRPLKTVAASLAADYFQQHPMQLTTARLHALTPYLDSGQTNALRALAAPEKPGSMPVTPPELLGWYRQRYLPYRIWQEKNGDAEAQEVVVQAAAQFIHWYLQEYPKALLGGPLKPHLLFDCAARCPLREQRQWPVGAAGPLRGRCAG